MYPYTKKMMEEKTSFKIKDKIFTNKVNKNTDVISGMKSLTLLKDTLTSKRC